MSSFVRPILGKSDLPAAGPFSLDRIRRDRTLDIKLISCFVPFIATAAYTAAVGTLYKKDCTTSRAIELIRDPAKNPEKFAHTACVNATFALDLPSLVLGVGISFALVLHVLFVDHIRRFRNTADANNLYDFNDSYRESSPTSLYAAVLIGRRYRLIWAIIIAGAALLFYWLASVHYRSLFNSLIARQRLTGVSVETLSHIWWADRHAHLPGAILWLALGVVGTYFSILDQWIFLKMRTVVRSGLPNYAHERDLVLEQQDHGLWLLTFLQNLKIVGIIVFSAVFIAVGYLVRDPNSVGLYDVLLAIVLLLVALSAALDVTRVRSVMARLQSDLFHFRVSQARNEREIELVIIQEFAKRRDRQFVHTSGRLADLTLLVKINEAHRFFNIPNRTFANKLVNTGLLIFTFYAAVLAVIPGAVP